MSEPFVLKCRKTVRISFALQTTQSLVCYLCRLWISGKKMEGPELAPSLSNTRQTQQHEACGFCYMAIICYGHSESPGPYRGPAAVREFLDRLHGRGSNHNQRRTAKAQATKHDETELACVQQTPVNCHICEKLLGAGRVRNHCHITGTFREAAHMQSQAATVSDHSISISQRSRL